MKLYLSIIVLLLSVVSTNAQTNRPAKSDIPTITFCDLIQNPDLYDGKEVRFRAKYFVSFEVAAFGDPNCTTKENRTWAEFDGISIKASAKPEIYQKVEEQIFCCHGGDNYLRETEMLVMGIFDGEKKGYGHLGEYRFMVTVKNVEEISETEKTKLPGFDPQ
jgi:starvation-inducible outer membrane lipoprotein